MTVLKNLIKHQNESTYLSGIAEETGLSHASVSRVITPLVGSGIILEKPLGKQIRTFHANMESEATKLIIYCLSYFVSNIIFLFFFYLVLLFCCPIP